MKILKTLFIFIIIIFISVVGCIVLAIGTIKYARFETNWISTVVHTERSADIPKDFDNKKIVFISDLHISDEISINRAKRAVKIVNDLKPDLILLGGDYISNDPAKIEPCFEILKQLKADMGVYGVMGNHDHWTDEALLEKIKQAKEQNSQNLKWLENIKLCRNSMKDAGITPLDNSATWIKSGSGNIKIGGVGDLWDDEQDISHTLKDTMEYDYVILLSHNPDYTEKITDSRIDLVLSGHTHGGQVTIFGLHSPVFRFYDVTKYGNKYRTGLVKTDYTKVLVSNGIGTVGYHYRFFARPQINVIILKSLR